MDNKTECNICLNIADLVSPGKKYDCIHEACKVCWKNIAKTNPVCPFCRKNLSLWLKQDMKFKIEYWNPEPSEPDWEDLINQIDINDLPNRRNRRNRRLGDGFAIIEMQHIEVDDELYDIEIHQVLQLIFEDLIDEEEQEHAIDDMFTSIGSGRVRCRCGGTCARTYMEKHKESKEHKKYTGNIKYNDGEVWGDDGKFHCRCSSVINPVGIEKHFQTKKHISFIENRNKTD